MNMSERSFDLVVREIVKWSLAEDIGTGDATTNSTIPEKASARAIILCKEDGILAGIPVANETFRQVDHNSQITFDYSDGDRIKKGKRIAELSGSARGILTAERTALNFLQRLSGIATITAQFRDAVKGTKAKITDTRKTTPGLRVLEKYAVRCGGGINHRMGLYDMILIKDNHIAACGSITNAVKAAKETQRGLKIEVECKSIKDVKEVIGLSDIDRVMFDNMSVDNIEQAVKIVNSRIETEASGGVNLKTVREIALAGVDYISVGYITHSARALDISLEIVSMEG
ncbi:carboxylating nicotinate-nucleotide diphosphorylase [bacterium]|nr:carboxylating nicotinate-nucleotide diphosphorylase [bacterium]